MEFKHESITSSSLVRRALNATCSILSFSIDDGDGDGNENVTFKMNWRFFKLFHVYSNSLKMSKVGKFL